MPPPVIWCEDGVTMNKIVLSLLVLLPSFCRAGSLPVLPPAPPGGEFSFAVLGDNRGSDSGAPAPEFLELLGEINRTDARFVLNTGDLVNGYTGKDQAQLRRQWEGYMKALGVLKVPMFNSPGNHDINDESAGCGDLWKEFMGPTRYSFDFGQARFISLDTSTIGNRLGPDQEKWLAGELESAGDRKVFIFFHAPLFPVDGHIGSALDQFSEDRDRIHALFAKNRAKIGAVFAGHEHLYNHLVRDGVNYYITGGGGAPVYAPRVMGGFFHFIMVSVGKAGVSIRLVKIPAKASTAPRPVRVRKGQVLEDWEDALSWRTWDQSVTGSMTDKVKRHGKRAWRIEYDFTRCEWPLIYTMWDGAVERPRTLTLDVYVPEAAGRNLSVSFSLKGKAGEGEKEPECGAPPASLIPGWNRVVTHLDESWVTGGMGGNFTQIQWVLSTKDPKLAGWVAFDNLVAGYGKDRPDRLIADWESGMTWDSWNEYVSMSSDMELHTRGYRGMRMAYDAGKADEPMVYSSLRPGLDFTGVKSIGVDIFVPEGGPKAAILLLGGEDRVESPPVPLRSGWNKVSVGLVANWLEKDARSATTVTGWKLVPAQMSGTSWAVLDNFRAE